MNAPAPLRRVAVIGDVHGEDRALETALAYLKTLNSFDALLCTGDIPDKNGVGDTERCCQLLQEAGVLTIRGNHDRWLLVTPQAYQEEFAKIEISAASRSFLRDLPPTREFETPLGKVLFCHGVGKDDMAGVYPGGSDTAIQAMLRSRGIYGAYHFLLSGHTHQHLFRPIGTLTALNAGTLCRDENPGFLIADFEDGFFQFYNLKPLTNEITQAEAFTLSAG